MRVGMEATGYSRWFERLLAEPGFELWIGDPAEIKTKSEEAKDRPQGCTTSAPTDARRQLSADLGTESREPGFAATAVASTIG